MKKLWSFFQYVFFLGLGIFLVWWQFDEMTPEQRAQFVQSLKDANYLVIIPVVIMSILSHISRAVRWKILIEPMGYKPSTTNTFYCVMTGYVANTFVPRAGEILKCSLLGKYEKIPANKLVGTVLVERAFDFICYLIIILITVLIQLDLLSSFVKEKFASIGEDESVFPLSVKLIVITCLVALLILTLRWSFRKYSERKIVQKIRGFTAGLKEGFNTITRLKNKGWFIAHTIFIWAMYLLQIYIGFNTLDATKHMGIPEAFSVLSLATLSMMVSPGGIGAFPLAVQEVLRIYGVENLSFGWLMWGVATIIILVVGALSFILLLIKNRKGNADKAQLATEDLQP
jgi:glycosyltransferase 2 family protein